MKKFILGVFVGIVLCGTFVYAYSYSAKDISYTPSNNSWKVNNIGDAIDSIKNTNDTTIASLQSKLANPFLNTLTDFAANPGRTTSDMVSVNASVGRYICSSSYGIASTNTKNYNAAISTSMYSVSGCDNYNLISDYSWSRSSDTGSSSTWSIIQSSMVFTCNNSTSKTISVTYNIGSAAATTPVISGLSCTKIVD